MLFGAKCRHNIFNAIRPCFYRWVYSEKWHSANSNVWRVCVWFLCVHALVGSHTIFSFHLYNEIKSTPKLLNTHARTRTPSEIHTNVWYLTRETNCQDPQQQQQQQHKFTLASFIFFGSCFDDWTWFQCKLCYCYTHPMCLSMVNLFLRGCIRCAYTCKCLWMCVSVRGIVLVQHKAHT